MLHRQIALMGLQPSENMGSELTAAEASFPHGFVNLFKIFDRMPVVSGMQGVVHGV